MRPSDDYEDIEETAVGSSGSRAVSWAVLAVAVGGFAALAYYAYHSGAKSVAEGGDAPVIEADSGPIKEAPADPGGEQFANKDKTIYDVIDADGKPRAEKLMPDPERPVIAADVEDSEDMEPAAIPPAVVAEAKPVTKPEAKPAAAAVKEPVKQEVASAAPAPEPVKAEAEKPAEKSFAAPEMINESSITSKAEEPKPEAKPEEKPAKPVMKPEKPAATGSAKVQLGAYASEEEARATWKKLSAKYGSVLTGSPTIVKAEVNGKTYYRLRTSVADAKAACAKINPCMAVK